MPTPPLWSTIALAALCAVLAMYDVRKGTGRSALFFAIGALGLSIFAAIHALRPDLLGA